MRDLPRRHPRLFGGLVVAAAVASIVAGGLLLDNRADNRAGLASTEDAVALGILDQEVLDAVRVDGEAIGIVSIETDEILAHVRAQFPDPAGRAEAFDAALGLIDAAKRRLTSELRDRASVVVDFDHLANIVLRFRGEDSLLAALRLPVVSAIRANRMYEATLDESRRIVRQTEAVVGHGGGGTYVAVLDTGVDQASYPTYFPSGSVASSYAAGDADGSALSVRHGTHVASTVLAMAPETRIIAVDVFKWELWQKLLLKGPGASAERILDGINHVMQLKRAYLADPGQCCNVVAMNLSLGKTEYHRAFCTDDYSFGPALALGIIPVVAAGNDALDKKQVFNGGVGHPACAEAALSVGATTDGVVPGSPECDPSTAPDGVTSFSQTGPTLQVLAPGSCIVAAGGAMQGTSMAAPHVAGAVAVLASARADARPSEIWAALTGSGLEIADGRISPAVVARRLDIAAAVERLVATAPAVSAPPASPAGDRSPPIVRPPAVVITSGVQAQPDGRLSVSVGWGASDDAGVARYVLRQRVGGGDWAEVPLPRADATTTSLTLAPGATYRFGVSAEDRAGNRSDWVDGPELALELHAEADAAIAFSGDPWIPGVHGEALGGMVRPANTPGAEACLTFTGRYVGWVATRAPDRGIATVLLDGRPVASVDLGTASGPRSVVYGRPVEPGATHVLCIRAEGAPGRPTIDVDGFAILR